MVDRIVRSEEDGGRGRKGKGKKEKQGRGEVKRDRGPSHRRKNSFKVKHRGCVEGVDFGLVRSFSNLTNFQKVGKSLRDQRGELNTEL